MTTYQHGYNNLARLYDHADPHDRDEGLVAYERYQMMMRRVQNAYPAFPLDRICAAFVSLSPNNDYKSNVRSLITLCHHTAAGAPLEQIVVSTYKHCRDRAHAYLIGKADFGKQNTGPKIKAFYHNIRNPYMRDHVTVDGHMVLAWRNEKGTMKDAIPKGREYDNIEHAVQVLALRNFMFPCQMQATLWFARKRIMKSVYDPQLDLFGESGDVWKTLMNLKDLPPYPLLKALEPLPMQYNWVE